MEPKGVAARALRDGELPGEGPSQTLLADRDVTLTTLDIARYEVANTISVYDAAYVAAADQVGGTLVSCDIRDLVSKGLASSPANVLEDDWHPPAGGHRS